VQPFEIAASVRLTKKRNSLSDPEGMDGEDHFIDKFGL
jgi:hypothetical protein